MQDGENMKNSNKVSSRLLSLDAFRGFAMFYWIIDFKGYKKWIQFAVVVGVNPLFIYLFAHVGGGKFIAHILRPFVFGLFDWAGELPTNIILGLLAWYFLWYITYWLNKKKIYIKI